MDAPVSAETPLLQHNATPAATNHQAAPEPANWRYRNGHLIADPTLSRNQRRRQQPDQFTAS